MRLICNVLLLATLIVSSSLSFSQFVKPFPSGIGLEVGGGHSDATWYSTSIFPDGQKEFSRAKLSFMPTVRVSYVLYPFESAQILPFVEYNRFGGRSSEMANGFKDEYWFDAVGFGLLATYSLSDFSVGPAFKLNYHLKVTSRAFGYANGPNVGASWHEEEFTDFYRRTSFDLGIRVAWTLNHWSIGAESWFGLTQLEGSLFDQYVDVFQRHYRLLVGFRL